jgi:ribose-phosphate pyrophosphokinase
MPSNVTRRTFIKTGAATAIVLPAAGPAWAQAWPSKPIKIVCGYPAGGLTDLFARAYGEYLSQKLGQPVVVENKAGAASAIGTAYVGKAAPDGYTLLMTTNSAMVILPLTQPAGSLSYAMRLFAGRANRPLAEAIATYLDSKLGNMELYNFSDGENYCQIEENVRGADVFIVQPTCPPVNDTLMELLVMLDAVKRASAARITAVLPYYGYARQDRKVQPRVPISAKLVADLITAAGAQRVLALDLHAGQIQGFFNIPVDHLFAAPVVIDYLDNRGLFDPVVVSPDAGGVERARAIAKRLRAGLAIIDKRRDGPNVAVFMHLIGDVKGKDAIIIDDMIDTAGTLVQAADALKREGARRILACGVHAVLSGPAMARIEGAPLEELVVTNSIPLSKDKQIPKITVLSVAPLLAEAIRRIHDEESVSTLFV